MSHLNSNRSDTIDELFRGILTLKSIDECYTFFSDLLTIQELTTFAQRLQVARLLREGHTYDAIRKRTSVSSSTITRINTELRYGSGGYRMVLDRLEPADGEPLSAAEDPAP